MTVSNERVTFAICTNPNIEDVLVHEINRVLAGVVEHTARIAPIEGYVFVDCAVDNSAVREALCSIRSAHYVMLLTCVVDLPQGPSALDDLCAKVLPGHLPPIQSVPSFRVRTARFGIHAFRSIDVERQVGELIHETLGVPGKMKGANTIVRADVIGEKVVFGVQIHNEELSKRLHPEFIRDASLKPNVAYAMLHFAGFKEGDLLLDPFVGSGTIALEAATRYPASRIIGMDKSERVVAGARANQQLLGLTGVELQVANARNLGRIVGKNTVDCIVTNPPWGCRLGKNEEMDDLYRGFLCSAADVLKVGGKLVVLLIRWESFLHSCRSSGMWNVALARPIRTGDMIPVMFVLERCEDKLWTTIKREIISMVESSKKGDGTTDQQLQQQQQSKTADGEEAGVEGTTAEGAEDKPTRRRRFSQ